MTIPAKTAKYQILDLDLPINSLNKYKDAEDKLGREIGDAEIVLLEKRPSTGLRSIHLFAILRRWE